MEKLLKQYQEDFTTYKAKQEHLKKLQDRYNRLLQQTNEKSKSLYKKMPSWVRVVEQLAGCLKKQYNFKYVQILGPFGLCCRISIWLGDLPFYDNDNHLIIENIYSLDLQPIFSANHQLSFVYETGEMNNKFKPGSIGELNGMNMITEPLPTNINDIYNIMVNNKERNYEQN